MCVSITRIFKYWSLIIILILIESTSIKSQNSGILRGFLTDSLSGEALPYGNVIIKELNRGTATDNRGYFLITGIPAPNAYTIVFSYVGYMSKEITAKILAEESTYLNIHLSPVSIELQTIEKIVKRNDEDTKPSISINSFTVKELESIPQGVEPDIFRSIQNIPGVSMTSDVSAKYYVRGGTNNQNLVLLNDATVYHPFHALGIFSIIDPEMINSIDFYKSGFPTEYSGRVSSVMDLTTKYGNKNQFSGTAALSLLSAKSSFEGPIPNGSFMITGRKSVSNEVLKNFYNNKNIPVSFYDFSFNMNYADDDFMGGARFILHTFYSSDKILNDNAYKADYLWKNKIYGISYFQKLNIPLFYKMSLNISHFDGEVDPKLTNIKPKKNDIRELTYKTDFTYVYSSEDILDVGIKISRIITNLYLQNSFGQVANISISRGEPIDWSIYGKYQLKRFADLVVELGTRLNIVTLSKGNSIGTPFEPRLRLAYRFSPFIRIQASAGVFTQGLTTLTDEDEVTSVYEPWIILPNYLNSTRSTHYVAGIDLNLTDNWNIGAESYYKKTSNLPILNKDKIFPTDPDLIVALNEAYGIEFVNTLLYNNINFTANYSLAWVYNTIDDIRYRPKYDARHTLNLTMNTNLFNGWYVGVVWTYRSGMPFTKLVGYYDKFYFNDNPNEFSILNEYSRFSLLDERNTGQTPSYHRLDINISKKFEYSFVKLFIGASILNIYNRENLFYFDLSTGDRVNMLPFLPSIFIKAEI